MRDYGIEVVTPPACEPVTLGELKAHLRVDHAAEDAAIVGYGRAAREWCEQYCERVFVSTGLRLTLPAFEPMDGPAGIAWAVRLPFAPVQSVTAVRYYDAAGASQTLAPAAYQLARSLTPPRLLPAPGQSWPTTQGGRAEAVEVEYTAGYGSTPAHIPQPIRQAILLLAGRFYEHRGDGDLADDAAVKAAMRLLGPYRTSVYS